MESDSLYDARINIADFINGMFVDGLYYTVYKEKEQGKKIKTAWLTKGMEGWPVVLWVDKNSDGVLEVEIAGRSSIIED